jgi:SulP family sulfate permease
VAGAVVAAMLVPQAMAYAALAGLPPEVGLYASLASLLVYGLLGPSRSLSVGPVAIDSLLTAQGLAALVVLGGSEAARLAALLAVMVAGAYLLFWALRLGALAVLLTGPVLAGFTHAAALVIAFSQVRHLARVPAAEDGAPWRAILGTFARLGEAHGPTLVVGLLSIGLLVVWKRRAAALLQKVGVPAGPAAALARCAPLVTVAAAAAAVVAFGLEARGVPVVGGVPSGLPVPAWPRASGAEALALIPTALVIALVGFLECLSIARTLAARRGEGVHPDVELFALGLANGAAGLAGGYPVTGGLSRSMVNHLAGAVSGRASVVTAVLIALALTVLAPAFRPIPRAALAAVVVVAVASLVDLPGLARLWRHDRLGGVTALGTFAAVLLLGVETGIGVGVGLALLFRALPRRPAEAQVD